MEDVPTMVLCKPKLLPLKSVTLEKLEKMQMEAQEAVKQQELAMKEQLQQIPNEGLEKTEMPKLAKVLQMDQANALIPSTRMYSYGLGGNLALQS